MKVLGYDIGRLSDPSGLVMLEGEVEQPARSILAVRRLPLLMRYYDQVDEALPLADQADMMVADGGGVGDAVIEIVRNKRPGLNLWAVKSTGGGKVTIDRDERTINIPKGSMVEHLAGCLDHRQIGIKRTPTPAADLAMIGELFGELMAFKQLGAKLEAAAGAHDDLIMATCLALMGFKIAELQTEGIER